MRCPFCGHLEDKVVDSRTTKKGDRIRRRRECAGCGGRYTTHERVEEIFPQIVKSDGSREDYDRGKVRKGIRLASTKRPISVAEIDGVVGNVEARMLDDGSPEVSSDWIGSAVTAELKGLDPVAYIRFASVYRGFGDIEAFLEELRGLEAQPSRGDEQTRSESAPQGEE